VKRWRVFFRAGAGKDCTTVEAEAWDIRPGSSGSSDLFHFCRTAYGTKEQYTVAAYPADIVLGIELVETLSKDTCPTCGQHYREED